MRVLYVATISNTINTFMIPHIELLLDHGFEVDIACNVDREISSRLTNKGCKVYNIEFQRSPFSKKNFQAYKKIKELIKKGNYQIVHTHTPVASALVRFSVRSLKNIKVIYTAHGFHFYKGAPIINWLIYYPIERYLAKYTDILITINKEDYKRAKKFFKAGKVEYIPGVGLDTTKYDEVVVNKFVKRKSLGVPSNAFVILSVGELNKNKNHETIIKAIAKLQNPNIYYLICGKGPLRNYLKELIAEKGIEDNVKLLGYRNDIAEICKIADVFAFPSKREGLGIAALEAMASGLPLITSNIHGIKDYSIDGITGFNCRPTDIEGFANCIKKAMEDRKKIEIMGFKNKEFVKRYDFEIVKKRLRKIYELDSLE